MTEVEEDHFAALCAGGGDACTEEDGLAFLGGGKGGELNAGAAWVAGLRREEGREVRWGDHTFAFGRLVEGKFSIGLSCVRKGGLGIVTADQVIDKPE